MTAILSLLLVLALSFVVVRVGAIALAMTGLSDEVARFQALSAFSGAGFTTGESENVVNGPARRRIVAWLIRLGSAGIVTAVSTLMIGFVGGGEAPAWEKLLLLAAGVGLLVWAARSDWLDRLTRPLIERALARATTLELRDYAGLLHLREDWRVGELRVEPGTWLTGGSLRDLRLRDEGVIVLGIEHEGGRWQGAPGPDARPREGDLLILYGRADRLDELAGRREGDARAHVAARRDADGTEVRS